MITSDDIGFQLLDLSQELGRDLLGECRADAQADAAVLQRAQVLLALERALDDLLDAGSNPLSMFFRTEARMNSA